MITSNRIEKIIIAIMIAAVSVCIGIPLFFSGTEKKTAGLRTDMEYVSALFDTSKVMEIDIVMDDKKWNLMLENAAEKKWQSCDVIVNGSRFNNAAIRTKGANSLEGITENPDSSRYSFKLDFGKYNKGQKCFGLDKLCLNNNYGDATNMKEALVYDMFRYMGSSAPLSNYAKVSINGEYWGVYLGLEAVEDSFLIRNYGSKRGALYKPGAEAADEDFDMSDWLEEETSSDKETSDKEASDKEASDKKASDKESPDEQEYSWEDNSTGGADLNYSGDDLSNYSSIFKCEVNKTDKSDHKRVVQALKKISKKQNLESYMDMDSILKYMAVHNFSVNYDSLLGDGDHNYYLYESDGKLSLIPWDYNLCFGAYGMMPDMGAEDDQKAEGDFYEQETSAADIVNKGIDDPWNVTTFFEGILENDEYRNRYHEYYQKLADEYVLGQGFQSFYNRTRTLIDPLVRTDPTALYTYQAYDKGCKTLQQLVYLRGQSVKGQIEGKIPSTTIGQKSGTQTSALIDASGINIEDMGGDGGMAESKEGNSEENTEEEWSEENMMKAFKEYMEQETAAKRLTKNKNLLNLAICLCGMLVVIMITYRAKYKR